VPQTVDDTDSGQVSVAAPGSDVVPGKTRVPQQDVLRRERLEARLRAIWDHRLGMVVAPAGSGKTSLLARFARTAGVPVAWYRAETWDGDDAALLRHLEHALTGVLPGTPRGWRTIEDAARALEITDAERVLLVVDDLHALEGTSAERTLERLIEYAPPWLAILVASRIEPGFNLSRLRVSGLLLEIGADDLRFRSWEVEELFRDFYGEHVPPTELAVLARRTEGWAAGLQLFHLATRGKPPEERRRILGAAGRSSRLVREYLAQNVLDQLPRDLRRFLVATCVLGRLGGRLCDELLARTGSRHVLEDLERRGVFTVRIDDEAEAFRYHEVLRSHLEWMLVDEIGEEAARHHYGRAAGMLEASGALPEALGAYCRAEDWASVRRLLGDAGERIVAESGDWIETLPAAVVRHDPWLILASARKARGHGRWSTAIDGYLRAEAAFGASSRASVCRQERLAVAAWLEPAAATPVDWSGLLRAAVTRDPSLARRDASGLAGPEYRLATGLAALLAGQVNSARQDLIDAADDSELSAVLAAAARLGAGLAAVLGGDVAGLAMVDAAAQEAELAGSPWLARLGRLLHVLVDTDGRDSERIQPLAGERDPWGEALVALAESWGLPDAEGRAAAAERAVVALRHVGAPVLEAWARALGALALADLGSEGARDAALGAETLARSVGAWGARKFAYMALAMAEPDRARDYSLLADAIREESGLAEPIKRNAVAAAGVNWYRAAASSDESDTGHLASANGAVLLAGEMPGQPASSLEIRCFGRFSILNRGENLDLGVVRPRVRMLLRLLTIHAGSNVHREVISEALWPAADAAAAAHGLQVAISSLRGVLEPGIGRGESHFVLHDGEGYRLAVPPDAFIDVISFDAAVEQGRRSRSHGDLVAAEAAFRRALGLHRGELLAEDGPADWVVDRREECRAGAIEAAEGVAEAALLLGDPDRAARACRAGLSIDRYHDPLWRLLIASRHQAGDSGAAIRARQEYEVVLATLGVEAVRSQGDPRGAEVMEAAWR
jgi:DNA-binding SARP family transcriptional activator